MPETDIRDQADMVAGRQARNQPGAGMKPPPPEQQMPRLSWRWRIAGGIAVSLALALAFVGYLGPDMRVQWANFVSLCGF